MRKTTAGIVFLLILTLMCGAALAQTRVLATTFSVYQIVRNITQNVPDVEVQLMLPAQAGCPHDYALTPQDMSKLAQADILVLNGLGLEAFLGSPSARAQKELHAIDSSKGISGLLPYTDAEAAEKCARYAHARPFTKESLLYRELFERFYPGQSRMVADFWMPNRDWPGCDVDDPSARVLGNYGASGI